jgi:N-acetylmuramoyl-L-alanine amidase
MSSLTIDTAKHLLQGERVQHLTCSKNTSKFKAGNLDTVVIHYTAGRDAQSSANYLVRPDIKASAHLVVGRKGEIYQLVPFDTISWHAGTSSYMGRSGYNKFSIGIELDNAGVLTKTGGEYSAWFGKKYLPNEVMQAVHRNETSARYWHIYTQEQMEACEEICRLLIENYQLKHVLGHEEISPGRKQDPGPAFPLDKLRDKLLSHNRSNDDNTMDIARDGATIPPKLNIRKGPSTSFEMVAQPLPSGAKVKVVEEANGWYKVQTTIEGWVSKGYVKLEE